MAERKMASLLSLLGVLIVNSCLAADSSPHWSYSGSNGPSHWYKDYPKCQGVAQSPINIYEGDVLPNSISEPLFFANYETLLAMTLTNNGHTAVVTLTGDNLPEISGGGLGGPFIAAQFHFHWSADKTRGSEHRVNSRGFPSEVHIVHYRKSYGTLAAAVDKADGLAVLGFMLEISASDNGNYANFISSLSDVIDTESPSVPLVDATMNSFLPSSFNKFVRYSGSLTTPPCYESVTWTVYKESIKISETQLMKFLELQEKSEGFILDNARPTMPVNGREVSANFDPKIKWTYYGGEVALDNWDHYYGACGGDAQSPINIPATASTTDLALGTLTFNNFDSITPDMRIKNNGHTVQVDISGGTQVVSGGGLPEAYTVAQFHLHWGSSSMKGSEHTLDGVRYPMEIHIVMYKSSLGSLGNAVKEAEGLAVLGFFFEIANTDNAAYSPILSKLTAINQPETDEPLPTVALDTLIPADRTKFYRYPGSLTTPGCYESVIWTVFDSTIAISEAQMKLLRAVGSLDKDSNGQKLSMVNNYRPVQNLNGRTVKANFQVTPQPNPKWTYVGSTGPQEWYKSYPVCASTDRQSPIDIEPRDVQYMKMDAFSFSGFDSVSGVNMKLTNNGHSVTVEYISGELKVSGGGLPGTFRVAQFHYHWGSTDSKGSEHTVGGDSFPLELHIVTYNEVYANIGLALTQPNGLAVLGFMYKISGSDNPNLEPMLASFPDIKEPKTETSLSSFRLDSMLASDLSKYFRYDGSLTTPSCAESVTWTVFYEPIPVSKSQLDKFRALVSSDKDANGNKLQMVDNFRPTLPVGNRNVYANFYLSSAPSTKTGVTTTILASLVFSLARFILSVSY